MHLECYNFKEKPFWLIPNPRFPQLAEPYRVALNTLRQSGAVQENS